MATPDRRTGGPEDRIGAIQNSFNRFERRVTRILGCLIAWDVAWVVILVLLINANSTQTDRIQKERFESTYNNCSDINRRHDKTTGKLNGQRSTAIKGHPRDAAQIRRDTAGAQVLIDALAPHRDCLKLARDATSTGR